MKRRALLKGAAAVALGASVPEWIRTAYAGATCDKAVSPWKGLIAISEGFRAAQRAGRPLLVLVIPANSEDRWLPGHAFGELFNHGSAEQLLPFAMVEVVCAKMAALRRLVPSAPDGEPLMVLVDTDRSPATARALTAKLVESPQFQGEKWDDYERAVDRMIDVRIDTIAKLVRDAVAVEPALSRYAAQNRAALTSAEQGHIASGEFDNALLNRAGPLLTAQALNGSRDDLKALLVASVGARTREKPPLGAKWALSSGCGVSIEDPEPEDRNRLAVACGMGHTPKRSRRFLYFFKRRGDDQEKDDD
jgi:hypothetical protein